MAHQLIEILLEAFKVFVYRHPFLEGVAHRKGTHKHSCRLSQLRCMPSVVYGTEEALVKSA